MIADILPDIQKRGMRPVENERITLRGAALVKHGAIIIGIFARDWMGLIPKCG